MQWMKRYQPRASSICDDRSRHDKTSPAGVFLLSKRGLTKLGCYKRTSTGLAKMLLLVGVIGVGGCSAYTNEPLHPTSARTIYVDMAQSREFRRGIEFSLTEALRKELDVNSPYKNAAREKADTILTAEVIEWRESTLGRNFVLDRPRETAATLVLSYRWQDMRTGKVLRDRPTFVTTVTYVRMVGESFDNAVLDIASRAARKIVLDMQDDW